MLSRAALVACGLLALSPGAARALSQPDGTVIPVRADLQTLFDQQQDAISALNNAAVLPETFNPRCDLTFNLISRGGATFMNVFGWYNATGAIPAQSDLHVLIDCNARPPASFPLAIKQDPAYKEGEVGFFLITPQDQPSMCASLTNVGHIYYSERKYNPDNNGPDSYIHLLIYDSKKYPSAFYFAWEDLFGGGDNEFTDFVSRVDGIVCSGGGAACDPGKPGVCAAGPMQCHNGALTCTQQTQSSAEVCDGLDNDCDSHVDNGATCPAGKICSQGRCVTTCGGEISSCPAGQVCNSVGACVDTQCLSVTCPEGKLCVAGACVGACDGVTCPLGQQCRVGRCVDPCDGLTCDAAQVCTAGICQPKCGCAPCPGSQSCEADGRCAPAGCAGKTCPAGQLCDATGTCVDTCGGAHCPGGGACTAGVCQPPVTANGDGGLLPPVGSDGGGLVPPNDADAGHRRDGGSGTQPGSGSGACGCAVGATAAPLLFALLALGVGRRRRAPLRP